MRGVLFDLPSVIERGAPALGSFEDRCERVPGSFFDSVTSGGDAYLMKHVIHDWDEDRCVTILRNCRKAMAREAKLLLVEMVLPSGGEPHPGKFLDLVMLLYTGGMERTEEQYAELLDKADFQLSRVIPTKSAVSIVEALPG
jgi:hypothetical protein